MVTKSENIAELALALSNLQGELEDVHKSSKGYGYNYADLSSVLYMIRPLLKKHGLSIAQPVGGEPGIISVTTILLHSSGQSISSTVNMAIDVSNKKMNSLQAAGSSITYLRRYCISSILGLSSTDDDGKSGGESMDDARAGLLSSLHMQARTAAHGETILRALEHYKVANLEQLDTYQLQIILSRINKDS